MKTFYQLFLSLSIVLLIISCNPEKYFGYSNEAEDLLKYAKVEGTVTNFYTGEPAGLIHVQVEQYETISDFSGRYYFTYILKSDDERNRPVTFLFSHKKYYPLEKKVIIDPLGMEVNASLHYAAPVIKETALFRNDNNNLEGQNYICQAIVLDYQGVGTIDLVELTVQLEDANRNIWEESFPMRLADAHTSTVGYFQTEFRVSAGAELRNGYRVYARDNEDFEETYKTSINPSRPDDPIF